MDLDFSESISQYRINEKRARAEVAQLAATMWAGFTRNEKAIVRIGMFPAEKMAEGEKQITHITDGGRLLACALMDCAKADGGMRA